MYFSAIKVRKKGKEVARKESITIEKISDTAFLMAREEGIESITARKLAAKTGCSTQPIFRVYKNMDELWTAVYNRTVDFFVEFYENYPQVSKIPFSRLGMAYIDFAREEKYLFRLLFDSDIKEGIPKKSMYEILNGKSANVVSEINYAKAHGCREPMEVFMRMWIFIHGAACMALTGDNDLTKDDTLELIARCYNAFLNS